MPDPSTGERVTDVLNLPSRDGLVVNAVRVDYGRAGPRVHRHPAGAYVYVIDDSVVFGIDDREPVVLKAGDSFYELPGALDAVSRKCEPEAPGEHDRFLCSTKVSPRRSTTVTDGRERDGKGA